MKFTIKPLIFSILIVASVNCLAANKTCLWKGKTLEVGQSVWVQDPFLVESYRKQLKAEGYDEKTIKLKITFSDFVGYRVICSVSVKLNPSPKHAGDILHHSEPFMMINHVGTMLHDSTTALQNHLVSK